MPAPWVLLIVEPTFEDGHGAKIESKNRAVTEISRWSAEQGEVQY